jgi:hypothetical protein
MTSAKTTFKSAATAYGVTAAYSGKNNTMFVSGEDARVKSFIRIRNLLGKAKNPFYIKQSK